MLIITVPALFFMVAVSVFFGVKNNEARIERVKAFQQFENKKVEVIPNIRLYAFYGYRTIYLPSELHIFTEHSGEVSEMISSADSSERLRVDQPLLDNPVQRTSSANPVDLSTILLLFAGVIGLIYGAQSSNSRKFNKMLASLIPSWKLFWLRYFTRLCILTIIFMCAIGFGLSISRIMGVAIPIDSHIAFFSFLVISLSWFFFSIGILPGAMKSKERTYLTLFIIWITVMSFIPSLIQYTLSSHPNDNISSYQMEIKKLEYLANFEKRFLEKFGNFTLGKQITDDMRNSIKYYMDNELQEINKIEEKLKARLKSSMQLRNNLMILFPITFYKQGMAGLSSMGDDGIYQYYAASHEMKKKFMEFYVNQFYFSPDGSDYKKVKNFIKGDDNITKGKSQVIENAWFGGVLTIFFIALFALLAFFQYRRQHLFIKTEVIKANEDLVVDIQMGTCKGVYNDDNLVYNVLSNEAPMLYRRGYNGEFRINGKEVEELPVKPDFRYICDPDSLPDFINPFYLVRFMGEAMTAPRNEIDGIIDKLKQKIKTRSVFHGIGYKEKALVILALLRMMKENSIIMIPDLTRIEPPHLAVKIIDRIDRLKQKNVTVLSLRELDTRYYGNVVRKILSDNIDTDMELIRYRSSILKEMDNEYGDDWEV